MSVPTALTEATASRTPGDVARLYWEMTRPRVLLLVLFTGLPVLAMGRGGWPGLVTAFWVLLGTGLAGGASSILNAFIERESDAQMARTRNRPLPAASMAPGHALSYGVGMGVASAIVLYAAGGWLAAAVGVISILFYVLVYTASLKKRTPQNIVIGGAAGATAPLIASAALDGHISVAAWVLFAIIFLWTPPHFWAIALYRKEEYAAAGIPMMPNVVGDQGTRWRMLAYTLALVPVSLIPSLLGHLSWLYGAAAIGLGAWFTWWNIRVIRARKMTVDRGMFKASIVYLFLLYGAMLADLAIPGM
jgi:protoheme IX farnesyltransferase